jgi:TRAP-type uncharacterized transport system fused permease subunit
MMSFVTPPVAVAAFAAASLAKADPFRTGFTAMRFGWVAYIVPFLFVYSPTLILVGEPRAIAIDIATAMAAIWLVSAGFVGYALRPISTIERGAFVVAGMFLLAPIALFPSAIYFNLAGLVIGAGLTGREFLIRSRLRREVRAR